MLCRCPYIVKYKIEDMIKSKKGLTPIGVILIILNPFLACLYSIVKAFYSSTPKLYFYVVVLFFALINVTIKAEETDYCWYLPLYASAIHTDLLSYLFLLNDAKEPLYTFINWIVAHIFWGNVKMFSVFSTFFFYVCGIEGIYSLGKYLKSGQVYVVASVLFFLFFPYIFANSANLLRQYYATAMMMWAIPEILGGNKKYWILALAAVFVHTSSGLLLLLLVMPFLKWSLSYKSAIFYIGLFLVLKFLAIIAGKLLTIPGLSFMTYALTKASTETTFETEYSIGKLLFAIVIVGVPFILINTNKRLRDNQIIVKVINLQLFFLIYIASNLNQAELCVRLNIYLWCFLPFNVLICIMHYKIKPKNLFGGTILLFIFFIYYMLYMTKYTYFCSSDLVFNTIVGFIDQSKI